MDVLQPPAVRHEEILSVILHLQGDDWLSLSKKLLFFKQSVLKTGSSLTPRLCCRRSRLLKMISDISLFIQCQRTTSVLSAVFFVHSLLPCSNAVVFRFFMRVAKTYCSVKSEKLLRQIFSQNSQELTLLF